MTNLYQASQVIRTWQKRHENVMDNNPEWAAQNLASDLLMEDLIAPDLPEPNDPGIFALNSKGWLPGGPDGPSVWTVIYGPIMVQRVEPGDLTSDEARKLAYALLAAANYSEGNQ